MFVYFIIFDTVLALAVEVWGPLGFAVAAVFSNEDHDIGL